MRASVPQPAAPFNAQESAVRQRLSASPLQRSTPAAQARGRLAESINTSPRLATQTQRKAAIFGSPPQQQKASAAPTPAPNHTGLPDQLKAGVEALSGMSLDHVRVHRNSAKPAQLQAHAYAQGSEIHLAPGQEKHLPHEAWHVVQQAQGRVKPTLQIKGGVAVNDDAGLEREADMMGARALTFVGQSSDRPEEAGHQSFLDCPEHKNVRATIAPSAFVVQRQLIPDPEGGEGHYVYSRSGESSSSPIRLTYFGHNRFMSQDGNWYSYMEKEDRLMPILRAPMHVGEPQPYAPIARSGFSMANRAHESTPWNSLLAAGERARDESMGMGLHSTSSFENRSMEFSPRHSNPAARSDLGRVMASHLGEAGRVSAGELAVRQDPSMRDDGISREYLHQQAHSSGGRDAASNLGIGSAAANTEMIPIEAAVNGRSDLRVKVVFSLRPGTLIIAVIEMTILMAANNHPIMTHRIAGQQRMFTRDQYDGLRRLVGFVVNLNTLSQMTAMNLTSPLEVAWVEFLSSLRLKDSESPHGRGDDSSQMED